MKNKSKHLAKLMLRFLAQTTLAISPGLFRRQLYVLKRVTCYLEQQTELQKQTGRPSTIQIPLRNCVHYCAFRYGRQEINPYENYQIDLCAGIPVIEARRRFIQFLRSYRPHHLGEALGISTTRPYALWVYPWDSEAPGDWNHCGWLEKPEDIPDILTHFCHTGIQSMRIDEEFVWLEKSLSSIKQNGYLPEKFGPARVLELRRRDGAVAYLLLDGNHRAGALVALGCRETLIAHRERIVCENEVDNWPGVRNGWMTHEDAIAVFNAYFTGNDQWTRSLEPADILGPSGWKEIYLS